MYYKVCAKCGHVGRNKFIHKWLYIEASSKKEAAEKAKKTPRVKHNHKDVIKEVIKIDFEEYMQGLKIMMSDKYFKVCNSTDQRRYNCINPEDIEEEPIKIKYRNKRDGQILRNIAKAKEMDKEIKEACIYDR